MTSGTEFIICRIKLAGATQASLVVRITNVLKTRSNIAPEIRLLGYIDSPIAPAAAICHGIPEDTPGLVGRVLGQEHRAILRHGFASFKISNIARWLGRQLLRKSHADYLEQSQRYVDLRNAKMLYPTDLSETAIDIIKASLDNSRDAYIYLRKLGIKKQDARGVMPEFTETAIVMSGNLQMWWDFFNLRIGKTVHPECQEVAEEILRMLCEVSEIFKLHPKISEITVSGE